MKSSSKQFSSLLTIIYILSIFLLPAYTSAADYLSFKTEDEANNIEIFRNASPSVVYVTNSILRRTSAFSRNVQEIPQGSGTGFIWDDSGLIVTNYHVIQGANRVLITLQDQSNWNAEVVGLAPGKDLALLRIDAPAESLRPLPLGDSSLLEVGRKVVAIGNPFGLDTTLTIGVVSALGREINSLTNRKIRNVIQTDASINPGNSGGPLLNSLGQLIGVNTQIVSPSGASAGIGFAIPVNTIKKIIPQLVEFGHEVRPTLGLIDPPNNWNWNWTREGNILGVPVFAVAPGYQAESVGIIGVQQNRRGDLLLGDVIIGINDIAINNEDDLLNALEQYQPGENVNVITRRNKQTLEFQLTLAAPRQ